MALLEEEKTVEKKAPKALSANKAVAEAVKDLDVDVISAYPITPQTTIVETLAEMIAKGELDAEIIHVESEHSALSAAAGATAVGARSFTATSSQGLALMHEILHIVSGLRLPVVMAVPMRALSAPISIWNDHSDVMNARDSGWIIYFVSNAQEAYDTLIQAYRLAEDPEVKLPVMVTYDGYVASHTLEPVITEGRKKVTDFSPKKREWDILDPDKPLTIGTITSPEFYYEIKYKQHHDMTNNALRKARIIEEEFYQKFNRKYGLIQTYKMEDAETALLVTTTYWDNARVAVDIARNEGIKAGVIKLRLYRPMPREELIKAVEDVKVLGVVDRAISYGARPSGPLANEIISTLYNTDVIVQSIVAGIGQRSMLVEDFVNLYKLLHERMMKDEYSNETLFYGVRGL